MEIVQDVNPLDLVEFIRRKNKIYQKKLRKQQEREQQKKTDRSPANQSKINIR